MIKIRRLLAACLAILVMGAAVGLAAAEEGKSERLQGADRYATSVAIAQHLYPSGAKEAILARGEYEGEYADGLSASTLAGYLDAPILLTKKDVLPQVVEQGLKDLKVSKVYIMGGNNAISPAVEKAVQKMGIRTERIYGDNREGTAAQIARHVAKGGTLAQFAFIVNGSAPADSLVAGTVAAKVHAPILQVKQRQIPQETLDALKDLGITQVYLVGGTSVISPQVENELKQRVTVLGRLSGSNRYETSLAVAQTMFPLAENYTIVRGHDRNLADAIGAALIGNPILYVNQPLHTKVEQFLDKHLSPYSVVKVIGGEAAVSAALVKSLDGKMKATTLTQNDLQGGAKLEGKFVIRQSGVYGPANGSGQISGTLYLDPGVNGEVTLRNVKVDRIVVKSGSSNSVVLENVNADAVDVLANQQESPVRINTTGTTEINQTTVGSSVILDRSSGSFGIITVTSANDGETQQVSVRGDLSGHTIQVNSPAVINVENGATVGSLQVNADVTIGGEGQVSQVTVTASNANVQVTGGQIGMLEVTDVAEGVKINVAQEAAIGALVLNSAAHIEGAGSIDTVIIASDGVVLDNPPANVIILEGVTAIIGGQEQTGTTPADELNRIIEEVREQPPAPQPEPPAGGGGPVTVPVKGITIEQEDQALTIGETLNLTVTFDPNDASNKNVTWTSSNPDVATVDSNGKVTAVGVGTATITVTSQDGGKSDSITIRVLPIYDGTIDLASNTWVTDRTEPKTWKIDNGWITLETEEEPRNNWYAWQGKKTATNMEPSAAWKVETTIKVTDDLLERNGVRSSMWLNIANADGKTIDWAILQFKHENNNIGWQYWKSSGSGQWLDIEGVPVTEGQHELAIHFNAGEIILFIDDKEVGSYTLDSDVSYVNEVIFNSYSFGESYSVQWKVPTVQFTKGDVQAADFGVMNFSHVMGYNVGFNLIDANASDVRSVVVRLYKNDTLLATATSHQLLTNFPKEATLSAPFDVIGAFEYEKDANWTYSGWMGEVHDIPTKAEITVTFQNGVVKTVTNSHLTGDTSIFSKKAFNISKGTAYDSIEEAVKQADQNDLIKIPPGTHVLDRVLNITKSLTISGFDKEKTIIVGQVAAQTAGIRTSLNNLTIAIPKNGDYAIYFNGNQATIEVNHSIFTGANKNVTYGSNVIMGEGGAHSTIIFKNNVVKLPFRGVLIGVGNDSAIENNIFEINTESVATGRTGAISVVADQTGKVIITGNTFKGLNRAIGIDHSTILANNLIIQDNAFIQTRYALELSPNHNSDSGKGKFNLTNNSYTFTENGQIITTIRVQDADSGNELSESDYANLIVR